MKEPSPNNLPHWSLLDACEKAVLKVARKRVMLRIVCHIDFGPSLLGDAIINDPQIHRGMYTNFVLRQPELEGFDHASVCRYLTKIWDDCLPINL